MSSRLCLHTKCIYQSPSYFQASKIHSQTAESIVQIIRPKEFTKYELKALIDLRLDK